MNALRAIWQPITKIFYPPADVAILKGRDIKPRHYLLEVENFSELVKHTTALVGSFESGGYQWDFYIYIDGYIEADYVSMYLKAYTRFIEGGEINVIFNLFIYNQLEDKYFGFQDPKEKRFYSINNKGGSDKFINLKTFKNPANGYLVDDRCVFGAEVFVIESYQSFVETLFSVSQKRITKYLWTFKDFSNNQDDKFYTSDYFFSEKYKWRLVFNPNNQYYGKRSISLGLELDTSSLGHYEKLYARCVFRIKNHSTIYDDYKYVDDVLFVRHPEDEQDIFAYIVFQFMAGSDLENPQMNFIQNDSLKIEVLIKEIGFYKPHISNRASRKTIKTIKTIKMIKNM